MKTVSVCFCGGCNPRIDRVAIAEKLKTLLHDYRCKVVYNERSTADVTVCLSGCPANCADKTGEKDTGACVVVAGEMVDLKQVETARIVHEIAAKVLGYLTASHDGSQPVYKD